MAVAVYKTIHSTAYRPLWISNIYITNPENFSGSRIGGKGRVFTFMCDVNAIVPEVVLSVHSKK